ncbi:MAG: phosphoribosylformylglycinamidine synthase, partial [Chromatiaceae bacterium]|nr:phosphoribosylformylglycinamidine synthase [Chromatiaceae bacterium]
GHPGEDARLYETVRAVGLELCPALGIAIPVGKDSMSMKTVWERPVSCPGEAQPVEMAAPLSLVVSAVAPVRDLRRCATPWLRLDRGETVLVLVDLGRGQDRLGGSALAQVYGRIGAVPPDLDDPALLKAFFSAMQALKDDGLLLAYHDRSDGGLLATLCEMAFAGRCGVDCDLGMLPVFSQRGAVDGEDEVDGSLRQAPRGGRRDPIAALFAEELGAVLQVPAAELAAVLSRLHSHGLGACSHPLGQPSSDGLIRIRQRERLLFEATRAELQQAWSETSWQMQRLRDNPNCADEEFARISADEPGLSAALPFDPTEDIAAPLIATGARPRLAVLREQGVNGQIEMAAAFDRAGFDCIDVHMSDLLEGRLGLDGFQGLAACGGFSYGDVLGAGEGWAKTILFNPRAREQFETFFARADSFALGVCNGCQMLANLRELIPGTEHWPHFVRNRSEQFEARLLMVEVRPSPSILLQGMQGARLPIVVSHGEGRAEFRDTAQQQTAGPMTALRYIEADGTAAIHYPANPNGSPEGITGLCNSDGRVTIMMPHPERIFRTVQQSWHPDDWGEDSPWMRLFRNARVWVG